MKTVEEECGEWPRGLGRRSRLRPEPAHRHLERLRSSVVTERDRLAVEDDCRDIQRVKRSDDLRDALGDVGEVAGEHAHVVVHTMCLDTRAIELPFDVRATQLLERARHVLGGLSQHRRDRPQRRQPEASQTLDALPHGDLRDRRHVAGEHRRTPHGRRWNVGGLRDRLEHHALERSLAKLSEKEPSEEALLGLRRVREQRLELASPSCLRARARDAPQTCDRRIDLEQLQGGRRGRGRKVSQRRPPHPNGSLRQHAGEIGNGDRDLVGSRLHETGCETLDLREPRRGRGDVSRCERDLREQHRRHSTAWGARATHRPRRRRGSRRARCHRGRVRSHRRSRVRARSRRGRAPRRAG